MKYSTLFKTLYESYLEDSKSEKNWANIVKTLQPFIFKLINSSKLRPELKEDAKSEILLAIYEAFRTYDDSKGALFYTWCYRLCAQAIWRVIRDNSNSPIITDAYNDKGELVNAIEVYHGKTEAPEIEEDSETFLKKILKESLRGQLEMELFSKKNGLFGEDRKKIQEIVEEDIFDDKTCKLLNGRNNNAISMLRKYIREFDVTKDSFNIEHYKKWRKTHKY